MSDFLNRCLENMRKAKERKLSSSHHHHVMNFPNQGLDKIKEIEYRQIINAINSQHGTEFYLELGDNEVGRKSFRICGHREFGRISRYRGNLDNPTELLFVGNREIPEHNTIRLIIDHYNNYIIIPMDKFWEISDPSFRGHRRPYRAGDLVSMSEFAIVWGHHENQ